MKSSLNSLTNPIFLLVMSLVILASSCNDKTSDQKGSYDNSDSCELITVSDVRSVFDLSNQVEIEQTKKHDEICYYKWQSPENPNLEYTVRFAFARWAQKSEAEMNKTWETQNKQVYSKHNLQEVPGIGDKASWSEYENGQLRVTEDGYIFYISIYVKPKNENPLNTQDLIEKTSALAKAVIKKM